MASYDYIIVGAGSAGCVLANRLSADGAKTVALIEAGGEDRNLIFRLPILAGAAYWYKRSNWGYETEPQSHLDGRRIKWPRGKVLGGSSTINGMMYMRGARHDYDRWAKAEGCAGWSYREVLPYFLRGEDAPERAGDPFHATGGELRVTRSAGDNPLYADFLASAAAEGQPMSDDNNGARHEGVGRYDFNIRNARRESSATAFLAPVRKRSNLDVLTATMALKVTIEDARATGLRVRRGGKVQNLGLKPGGEVILASGSVNTPQLLMFSGVGDPAQLAANGIEPLLARPEVGRNLHDHLGVYVTYACKDPVTLFGLFRPDRAARAFFEAMVLRRGPMTAVPLEVGGMVKSHPDLDQPDLHMTFVPGLSLETTRAGQGEHGYIINFYPLRPESRGEIRLASPDPMAAPVIDPNYLATEADRATVRDGTRLAQRIGGRSPLAERRRAYLSPETGPLDDDPEIDAWVRAGANTIFHPVGTARMGSDAHAVVDPKLRVRGIAGLRVADASVMPSIVGGNTSAPTMMIAEKAADMILGRPALAPFDPAEAKP